VWFQASAIGKNMTNAKTFLEKRYSDEMGLEDAVHTSLLTLKEGFEGQVSGSNIEVRLSPCWQDPPRPVTGGCCSLSRASSFGCCHSTVKQPGRVWC